MKDGSDEKMMSLFWLHWFHAPSLVSRGQSKLKLLSENRISIFSNSDLDLDHRHLSGNHSLTPFRIRPPARPTARPTARPPFANLITRIFVENLVNNVCFFLRR